MESSVSLPTSDTIRLRPRQFLCMAVAVCDHFPDLTSPLGPHFLSFSKGQKIKVTSKDDPWWWEGMLEDGNRKGRFPWNTVKVLNDASDSDEESESSSDDVILIFNEEGVPALCDVNLFGSASGFESGGTIRDKLSPRVRPRSRLSEKQKLHKWNKSMDDMSKLVKNKVEPKKEVHVPKLTRRHTLKEGCDKKLVYKEKILSARHKRSRSKKERKRKHSISEVVKKETMHAAKKFVRTESEKGKTKKRSISETVSPKPRDKKPHESLELDDNILKRIDQLLEKKRKNLNYDASPTTSPRSYSDASPIFATPVKKSEPKPAVIRPRQRSKSGNARMMGVVKPKSMEDASNKSLDDTSIDPKHFNSLGDLSSLELSPKQLVARKLYLKGRQNTRNNVRQSPRQFLKGNSENEKCLRKKEGSELQRIIAESDEPELMMRSLEGPPYKSKSAPISSITPKRLFATSDPISSKYTPHSPRSPIIKPVDIPTNTRPSRDYNLRAPQSPKKFVVTGDNPKEQATDNSRGDNGVPFKYLNDKKSVNNIHSENEDQDKDLLHEKITLEDFAKIIAAKKRLDNNRNNKANDEDNENEPRNRNKGITKTRSHDGGKSPLALNIAVKTKSNTYPSTDTNDNVDDTDTNTESDKKQHDTTYHKPTNPCEDNPKQHEDSGYKKARKKTKKDSPKRRKTTTKKPKNKQEEAPIQHNINSDNDDEHTNIKANTNNRDTDNNYTNKETSNNEEKEDGMSSRNDSHYKIKRTSENSFWYDTFWESQSDIGMVVSCHNLSSTEDEGGSGSQVKRSSFEFPVICSNRVSWSSGECVRMRRISKRSESEMDIYDLLSSTEDLSTPFSSNSPLHSPLGGSMLSYTHSYSDSDSDSDSDSSYSDSYSSSSSSFLPEPVPLVTSDEEYNDTHNNKEKVEFSKKENFQRMVNNKGSKSYLKGDNKISKEIKLPPIGTRIPLPLKPSPRLLALLEKDELKRNFNTIGSCPPKPISSFVDSDHRRNSTYKL